MVYEARPGQTFLLGATAWRIEEIGRDRVIVTPAPGAPGAVPFWRGDSLGRPRALGEAIGAFSRWAVDQPAELLEREYDLDPLAARNLLDFLREQQAATGVAAVGPHDRRRALPRRDRRLAAVRALAVRRAASTPPGGWRSRARIRERYGLESDAIWSDDGIIVHLPDTDEPPSAELVLPEPDEVEELVMGELAASALFGARFRENAARALLIPRAYPGRRTPLWQQRLKAQTLLEVARRYPDFPIILETYRECLRDVLDVAGVQELLRALARRELSLVEVETPTASPFASSLLFDYVATYMYEGDAPNAERRAAALSLDRELLRELLGQEELRELIDPGALEALEADLQRRSPALRATSRDELHDVLRTLGDLTAAQVRERVLAELDADAMLAELVRERRAVEVRVARERRWIAAQDAGLYRDALGVVPPSGLPEAFLDDVPDALRALAARHARSSGPFTTARARAPATASTSPRRCASSRPRARSSAASFGRSRTRSRAPGEREWCDPEVLRRLRRSSLAVLRREIEPAERRALASFLPSWQGVDRHPAAGAGIERLREVLVPLQGLALPAELWERAVLPRRTRRVLDELARSAVRGGRARLGRGGRDRPSLGTRRALLPRRRGGDRAARGGGEARRTRRARARADPRAPAGRAVLLRRPRRRARRGGRGAAGGAVGPRLGGRGDQRRVGPAAGSAPRARPLGGRAAAGRAAASPRPRAPRAATRGPPCRAAGRSPPASSSRRPTRSRGGARSPSSCSSATGSSRASSCSRRA